MLNKINILLFRVAIVISLCFTGGTVYNTYVSYNKNALNDVIYSTFVGVNNSGSGSVIKAWTDKGKDYVYVLTAAHVVRPDTSKGLPVKVTWKFIQDRYGTHCITDGTIEEYNESKDFCILKYQLDYLSKSVVCDIGENDLLDRVYSVGMPNSSFWVTSGTIASTFSNNQGFISHNAPGFYGNSGGPLYNSKGHQIGVNLMVGKAKNLQVPIPNIGWAISIKEIKHTLGKDKFNKYFGRCI